MTAYYQRKKLNLGRDYIAAHYTEPFCLATIAKSAHLSPYHFLRAFKKTYGQTPNEFLIQLRLTDAKHKLITESMSISDVCNHIGYASLGSFSALFLRQVGISPSHYRRKLWSMSTVPFHFPKQVIPACYAVRFLGKPGN